MKWIIPFQPVFEEEWGHKLKADVLGYYPKIN